MSPSFVVKALKSVRNFSPSDGFGVVSGPMRSGASSLASWDEDIFDDSLMGWRLWILQFERTNALGEDKIDPPVVRLIVFPAHRKPSKITFDVQNRGHK
jgi:hypothetical protein